MGAGAASWIVGVGFPPGGIEEYVLLLPCRRPHFHDTSSIYIAPSQ